MQNIDTIFFNDFHLADPSNVPYRFTVVFKGCTTMNYNTFDTTYIFLPQTAWAPALNLMTCWDTSSNCAQPSFFTCTDTLLWRPCFPVKIEELETEGVEFTIYPNPVNDRLFIQSSESIKSVMIYSILGQLALQAKTSISEIDVASLKQGVYFMQVQFESGITQSQKILIQR